MSRILEAVAAAALGTMTILIFLSVTLRATIDQPIPDTYDLSSLLLGVTVLWGIAGACRRRDHIRVDALYLLMGPRLKTLAAWTSHSLLLVFFGAMAWKLLERTLDVRRSGEVTQDLNLPIWPFYLWALAGLVAAVGYLVVRTTSGVGDKELSEENLENPQ